MRTIRTLAAAALIAALASVAATGSASAKPVDLKTTTYAQYGWYYGG